MPAITAEPAGARIGRHRAGATIVAQLPTVATCPTTAAAHVWSLLCAGWGALAELPRSSKRQRLKDSARMAAGSCVERVCLDDGSPGLGQLASRPTAGRRAVKPGRPSNGRRRRRLRSCSGCLAFSVEVHRVHLLRRIESWLPCADLAFGLREGHALTGAKPDEVGFELGHYA